MGRGASSIPVRDSTPNEIFPRQVSTEPEGRILTNAENVPFLVLQLPDDGQSHAIEVVGRMEASEALVEGEEGTVVIKVPGEESLFLNLNFVGTTYQQKVYLIEPGASAVISQGIATIPGGNLVCHVSMRVLF